MKYDLLPADQLSADLRERWATLASESPQLASPYFRPEFTAAVAAACDDVEVGILEDAGEVVGFWPYQRGAWNVAHPVGGRLSDFQGAIVRPGIEWNAESLLQACGLRTWEFDHLLADQTPWQPFHLALAPSRFMDLSQGFAAYQAQRQAEGSKRIAQTLRMLGKLERDCGTVHCVWNDRAPATWQQLRDWKSRQYRLNGLTDLFALPWVEAVLQHIAGAGAPAFGGVTSALYVGERLIAIHFGMRSYGVLHSWFPAYDREFSKYSPGLILNLLVAQQAAEQGITKIDLGKGEEEYKLSLASGSTQVAEGAVDRQPLARTLRSTWRTTCRTTRDWVKLSPLGRPAKLSVRWMRRMRDWMTAR